MKQTALELWNQFQRFYREYPTVGLALDFSRMDLPDAFLNEMEPAMQRAYSSMEALESGAIANPDENRMVGHYWLRNVALAPNESISKQIKMTLADINTFAQGIHSGQIVGEGGKFRNVLVIGIGGSALGPQFVAKALGSPRSDKMKMFFVDNTDPDGIDTTLQTLGDGLNITIVIVISKSGGTKETRNGMLEVISAYERAGLTFQKHAVAITMAGSSLDECAVSWIARFPMWDWVGGRTSQLSAVGLLSAALQGLDIDSMVAGAGACDNVTRSKMTSQNPAAMLALSWFHAGRGRGQKNMVVLPYKDRLELFSKYLQQLVMESLGKELYLDGNKVNQGLTVFGNKGSTDQHSYIQQLRDGLDNFFAVFIEVQKDRLGFSIEVEPNTTTGDFLQGFLLGTRAALYENGRQSITITIPEVTSFAIGVLIALFERSVGFYASLTNVNAYHQPGVQAGKLAADEIINLKVKIINYIQSCSRLGQTPEEISKAIDCPDQVESVFKICDRLAANSQYGITKTPGTTPFSSKYCRV